MYYVIGADGKMNGPLSVEEVHQWLAEGFANKYSRVRRDGEETWQPLSSIPELAPPPPAPASRVVATDAAPRPETIVVDDRQHDVSLDVGRCVSRGWTVVRDNPLVLVAAAGVAWSVLIVLSFLPRVGWIAGIVVNSPMLGGLYYVYLRTIRGHRTSIEDVLAGFRLAFVPLLVAGLLCGGLTTLALLPAGLLSLALTTPGRLPPGSTAAALTIAGLALLSVPGVYLAVSYIFVVPIVMDKRVEVWTAMELSRRVVHRQWWTVFALAMVSSLMVLAGLLAFGVGVVIAVPAATAAMMYAYEDLFGSN